MRIRVLPLPGEKFALVVDRCDLDMVESLREAFPVGVLGSEGTLVFAKDVELA